MGEIVFQLQLPSSDGVGMETFNLVQHNQSEASPHILVKQMKMLSLTSSCILSF